MLEENEGIQYIPFSFLNAYAYCPRRFYYEFTLGEMVINEHVFEGQQLHERVDQPGSEMRGEKIQLHRAYLCAPLSGLVGYCDLLEMTGSGDLAALARLGKAYPVEYKKGKMGKWLSDHTQLCAQALALEEVLSLPEGSITRGYLYYIGSARRDEIPLDTELRHRTRAMLVEARRIAGQNTLPDPISNWRKCRDCSLEPQCLPRETLALNKKSGEEDIYGDTLSD
jgi:CRISPR-associated exonuclease Cas4